MIIFDLIDSIGEVKGEALVREFNVRIARMLWSHLTPELRAAVILAEDFLNGVADERLLFAANQAVGEYCDVAQTDSAVANLVFHATYQWQGIAEVEDVCQNALAAGIEENKLCEKLRSTFFKPAE